MNNYKKTFENIKPSDDVMERLATKLSQKQRRSFKFSKPIIVALCLILALPTTLLAKEVAKIYQLMNFVPPEIAQEFVPIEEDNLPDGSVDSESTEMKLEVVSASIKDNVARLYITLDDFGKGIIDETTMLNSYDLDGLGTAVLGCEQYDFTDGKATFMVTISDKESEDILETISEQITFKVFSYTTAEKNFGDGEDGEDFKIDVDLASVLAENLGSEPVRVIGASGDFEKYTGKTFLELDESVVDNIEPINIGIPNFSLTAVAYSDGLLHLKAQIDTHYPTNDHVALYLREVGDTTNLEPAYTISYANFVYQPDDGAEIILWHEYIFDIPKDDLQNYQLYAMGEFGGDIVETDLEVSFNINDYLE